MTHIQEPTYHDDSMLTIKQAEAFLSQTEYPFASVTIRMAIKKLKLPATLVTASPSPYYQIDEIDLIEWARDSKYHKGGRVRVSRNNA